MCQRLFENAMYPDLTIKTDDTEYQVHRAVVCMRSKFFAAACIGPWKEAKDLLITLHDDDMNALDSMFEYLYTGRYGENFIDEALAVRSSVRRLFPDTLHSPSDTSQPSIVPTFPVLDLAVYAVADKYDIPDLLEYASRKVEEGEYWKNASGYECLELICEVYHQSGNAKSELVSRLFMHKKDLILKEMFEKEECSELLKEVPEMAIALLAHL